MNTICFQNTNPLLGKRSNAGLFSFIQNKKRPGSAVGRLSDTGTKERLSSHIDMFVEIKLCVCLCVCGVCGEC